MNAILTPVEKYRKNNSVNEEEEKNVRSIFCNYCHDINGILDAKNKLYKKGNE